MQENINIPDSNITTDLTFRNLCFMNMQRLTNFPYIEKDFDAISDYQLLCKVVEYLNMVIKNSNDQNDSITNLYNSFVDLQTYVNTTKDSLENAFNSLDDYVRNYFANLDVQQEINNKLDQMLEDGVLEQIIEQFLQSTALWCFDTVDDMKDATNLISGSYVRTLGYSTLNDGLGQLFKITDTEDSTIEQIDLENGLYANIIKDNVVTINDFEGETAEEKLFKALDTIPSGTILIGDITISHVYNGVSNKDYRNITIMGGKLTLSVNRWFNQNNTLVKSVPILKDVIIVGNNNEFYNNETACTGPMFLNCDIRGLCIFNSTTNYIQSLYINGCTIHSTENLLTCDRAFDLKITSTRIEQGTATLLNISGNNGDILQGAISNCLIEGRTNVVIQVNALYDFIISNCYFENNLGGLINQTGTSKVCFLTVRDCSFLGSITSDYAITLQSSAYSRTRIINNMCNYATGKLLCNKNILPENILDYNNYNYAHLWKNSGFNKASNSSFSQLTNNSENGTWNADDSSWNYTFNFDYTTAYLALRPLYVYFMGEYGSTPTYQGFAILRLTPRTCYSAQDGVHTVCDLTIVDSCNKNTVSKTSDVTAEVSLSSISTGETSLTLSVKVKGFTSGRGVFRVIDPFRLIEVMTKY